MTVDKLLANDNRVLPASARRLARDFAFDDIEQIKAVAAHPLWADQLCRDCIDHFRKYPIEGLSETTAWQLYLYGRALCKLSFETNVAEVLTSAMAQAQALGDQALMLAIYRQITYQRFMSDHNLLEDFPIRPQIQSGSFNPLESTLTELWGQFYELYYTKIDLESPPSAAEQAKYDRLAEAFANTGDWVGVYQICLKLEYWYNTALRGKSEYGNRLLKLAAEHAMGTGSNLMSIKLLSLLSFSLCESHRYEQALKEVNIALSIVHQDPDFESIRWSNIWGNCAVAFAANGKFADANTMIHKSSSHVAAMNRPLLKLSVAIDNLSVLAKQYPFADFTFIRTTLDELYLVLMQQQNKRESLDYSLAQVQQSDRERRLAESKRMELEALVKMRTAELHMEVKKRRELEQLALKRAYLCPLTNLPNRQWLQFEFPETIQDDLPLHLFFIDLNDFKSINDIHGHFAGDIALKSIAAKLAEVSNRFGGKAVRVGGDEFIVLVQGTLDVEAAKTQMEQQLNQPIRAANSTHIVGASIGYAQGNIAADYRDPLKLDQLIRNADASMYAVKKSRQNNVTKIPDKKA
ncbi:MAG: GGDEF domain-containing protein [Gammaproteobacteria bacterium]|nr:GGDEF domain-containing protein [Gammaproteobacteria bacterium]